VLGRFPSLFSTVGRHESLPFRLIGAFQNKCRCTPDNVLPYRAKISGSLLDRIDILIDVPALKLAMIK
jgi:magnesium chelatase family protein